MMNLLIAAGNPPTAGTVVVIVGGFIVFVLICIFLYFFKVWIRALASGARVKIGSLIGMKLRKVSPLVIVDGRIMAVKAGLDVSTNDLETHYLAGGNVNKVIRALIAADKANIELSFKRAAAIDLAGRDVLEAVQTSVNPRVIDAPNPARGSDMVAAVAMDGISLKAKAKVTVRANLDRLVGGATEETIVARVGEGIVTTIGSAQSYKQVLENPDRISKTVLAKGLDSGTAFEILSIDIADVDVGENVGAKLETERAEADKRIAQAKAEGHLGVMDYYQLRNIQADTSMRDSIAGTGPTTPGQPAEPSK
jgi:uncharacterized protein YqfA (UPF0365 family)